MRRMYVSFLNLLFHYMSSPFRFADELISFVHVGAIAFTFSLVSTSAQDDGAGSLRIF